ncbi:MAG: NUDIX domain-containing protein [Alphaproteobacteria bacterium]|nr:NUDIX domain-containing protein [Alphaproteobacteria bacterium]
MTADAVPAAPVRPRDAATLILVRDATTEPRLLMGRRVGGHAFMPDKWVFPGGRLHPSDYRVETATDLSPATAALLAPHARGAKGRALALAAIRETFEEAGLLMARPAAPARSRGVWGEFLAAGARPHLGALSFIGRAITPPMLPRRFDARFFMADADELLALEPTAGCGELDGIAWMTLAEARQLDLPTVTRMMIDEVATRLGGGPPREVYFPRGV